MRGALRGVVRTAALALAVGAASAAAQVPRDTTAVPVDTLTVDDVGATFEALLEDDVGGDPTALLELLNDLRENPLDVNAATAEELAQVPALDPLVAASVVRYRAANGPFASLPEIQLVPGVTPDVYLDARPYLTIGPRLALDGARPRLYPQAPTVGAALRALRFTTTQRLQRRLDTPAGYAGPDSVRTYAGSRDRIYTRVQAAYRRQLSLNVTLEKDPGEAFVWDGATNTYGYDYLSGHAAILDWGRVDALVVGDFVAEFGQGVALWRASGFGKGPDAVRGPIRSGRGLRPYGSVDENQFFRGAGLTVAVRPGLYATAFASRRRLDASVFVPDSLDLADPDLPPGTASGALVTGLSADGLHRTPSELAKKDALGETLVGGGVEGRVTTSRVVGRAGIVGYSARFDAPLGAGTRPDEQFDFAGQTATTLSLYADAKTRAGQAFAEVARGAGGGVGGVAGLALDLGGGADALLVGRHYAPDFTSLHGYPFGERNGIGQNETGLYGGLRVRPSRSWTLSGYADLYRFPYLRFNVPRPSQGHEALVFVEHRPRRYLRVYAQARTETREVGVDVPNGVPGSTVGGLAPRTRQSLRLHGEWEANNRLRFRARVEGIRSVPPDRGAPDAYGTLVYQDVRYAPSRRLRIDGRLVLFRSDAYDARLYAFENDLTGVFAIPVLSGRGTRAYVLVAAEPIDGLVVQAKLAATVLRGVRSIGTGPARVDGQTVRDLGLQVRYRF